MNAILIIFFNELIEAVSELTFYDEKVVWTEAKKYCEYTNTTLIGINTLIYGGSVLDDSLKLNLTRYTLKYLIPLERNI